MLSEGDEIPEAGRTHTWKRVERRVVRILIATVILLLGYWLVNSWIVSAGHDGGIVSNFLSKVALDLVQIGVPGAMALTTIGAGLSVLKSVFSSKMDVVRSSAVEDGDNHRQYIDDALAEELMSVQAARRMRARRILTESVSDPHYGPFIPEVSELDQIKSRAGLAEESALLFTAMRVRLVKDEVRLRSNSRLNLMIGAFVALIAISLMGYPLVRGGEMPNTMSEFWASYMLRVPVALLLQIVSFFFLRLYVSTENEIKHNKNEVTNVESKFLSLIAAREFGFSPEISIRALADTERNFVIKRGEKTVGSENDSRYNDIKSILERVVGLIPPVSARRES